MNIIQLIQGKWVVATLFFLALCNATLAQEFTPMKSPDVAAFVNANYMPVNESTGRADITVPIYTIDLDGMAIPISISYDTGGVKVDAAASTVGLNWTLNAGGFINKEIIGQEDIFVKGSFNENSSTGYFYLGYGFLRDRLNFSFDPNHPISQPYRDTQPDRYYVMAPGLSTEFTHKADGNPFELSNTGTIIKSPFQDNAYLTNMYWRFNLKPGFKFELTPTNGFEYSFEEVGLYYLNTSNGAIGEDPILASAPLPENTTVDDLEDLVFPYAQYSGSLSNLPDLFPTIHLSSIRNPTTKNAVTYFYKDNNIVDNNRRIEVDYSIDGGPNQGTGYEHDFTTEKLISKIVFPKGTVDFYYEDSRLDVRSGQILKKIEVRNNLGELVKAAVFEQDYFTSVENCTDNHCYRLRLNAVKFLDKDNNVLPGYSFEYDSTKLPKRFAVSQDFTGYFNNEPGAIPKVYYNVNQGRASYIPFPSSGYALTGAGDLEKTANLTYAKAATLQRITYPTGGATFFEYELNSFKFLNNTIQGGGLRLAAQNMYDSDNSLERRVDYDYSLSDGSTSGSITRLPSYVRVIKPGSLDIFKPFITEKVNSKLELTNGSFITYSQVKVSKQDNGYTINEYTNALDYPNIYPTIYTSTESNAAFDSRFNDGLHPSTYQDMSIRRSKLKASSIFDESNTLLKRTSNQYLYKVYEDFTISENIIFRNPNFQFTIGNNAGYATFNTNLSFDNSLLEKTIVEEYLSSGVITNEQSYTFDSNLPLVKVSEQKIDEGEVRKEVVFYPFDPEVSSLPNINLLRDMNRLAPIRKEYFKDNSLLGASAADYEDFGADQILPIRELSAKESDPLEPRNNFKKYDKRGNLIEYAKENGMTISVLWGYDYQFKLAEILNADYDQVLSALNASDVDYLQTLTNDELEIIITNLRTNLPDAQIYSYRHNPMVGVTAITDPKGLTSNYSYDSFKRMLNIRDHNNLIISEYDYNYKLTPSVNLPTAEPLTVNLIKGKTLDYELTSAPTIQNTLLSAMVKGGRGDYVYEWRLAGSTTILSRAYKLSVEIPCDNSSTYTVKVTDSNGTVLTETVTINAPNCGEAFYLGPIEGSSEANNQNNFWINAEGASYGSLRYRWFIAGGPLVGNTISYDDNSYPQSSGLLFNNSGNPVTVDLSVEVLDVESGFFVIRTQSVEIQPEFETNSCFVAGTMITMADGSTKPIEKVLVGDLILTFNTDTKKTETGEVEEVVSPLHSQLVTLEFENNIININTYDHPYYVKKKGWCSYNPQMTSMKYGLEVNEIEVGDIMLSYDPKTRSVQELRLSNLNNILKSQKTYNLLKVSKNHNFFANGVLVHNKFNANHQPQNNR